MATRPVELSGVAVVAAGSFNPAIFQPNWFNEKQLITTNAAEDAQEHLAISPELSAFTADWLSVQVTLQQAVFATVDEGREFDLRDAARGAFDLLPETPVDAVGINTDVHLRVESEAAWHAFGDTVLPKDLWEPIFANETSWLRRPNGQAVGLRALTVEVAREGARGLVRLEVAPSVRISPNGVYVGVNAHYQLSTGEHRGTGYDLARLIDEQWESTRSLHHELITNLLSAVGP